MSIYFGNKRVCIMLDGKRYSYYKPEIIIDNTIGYVSMGDSIAGGHAINDDWKINYGEESQYGEYGNTSTVIVPQSYTDLIKNELIDIYGENQVYTKSFARSGDRVKHLIEKLSHDVVRKAVARASLVTICIGANDVLTPALSHLEEYINAGDSALAEIASIVEANLVNLNDDTSTTSYKALFDKFTEINPNAKYVFTTVYNPYKYLWISKGTWANEYNDSFFAPIFKYIPEMTTLGVEWDRELKKALLNTSVMSTLFDRVNGLDDWAENYVSQLNAVLRNKINEYNNSNFMLADTKVVYDTVPDRPITAEKHYNDLVNVEFTRGYDTAQMDWGRLWDDNIIEDVDGNPISDTVCNDAGTFWDVLLDVYMDDSYNVDYEGLASTLVNEVVNCIIVPDADPHPEAYGHYVLKRSFSDALGWASLNRYTITFNANGGSGTMASQEVITVDNLTAYANIKSNEFSPTMEGYHFIGWNTKADGSGTSYSNGQFIGISGDIVLYAQWSNLYTVTYKHTNHTNLYGDDETGHKECYALYIDGVEQSDFGTFAEGNSKTYSLPYGTTIKVVVSNYNPTELTYDDVDCDVYWNGVSVASGYRGTEYSFTLTCNVTIDFQWKIAGSLVTFDMRSWEDCYITTG